MLCHPSESSQGWGDVLGKRKEQRVRQIDLVISDGLVEIEDAVASHFSEGSYQLWSCVETIFPIRNRVLKSSSVWPVCKGIFFTF